MTTFVINVNPVSGDHADQTLIAEPPETSAAHLAAIGRALWRELFTTIETAEQLADWESRIPRFDCDCYRFYERWKSANPPSFPLSFHWKYNLKSAVNKKLGALNISEAEARLVWYSQRSESSSVAVRSANTD